MKSLSDKLVYRAKNLLLNLVCKQSYEFEKFYKVSKNTRVL